LIGRSDAIAAVRRDVGAIAESGAPIVLISGETGTGKEIVARAIHDGSPRRARPFVSINCSAVPATLLEDAFFGHERGAYTDARDRRAGLIEEARGGTLFLDEVGELDLGVQAKFLRLLEEGKVRRLGAEREIDVDIAFVAATNRDLAAAVRAGAFRNDLYYRLNVVELRLPPLRDRPGDVPLLAAHFLRELGGRFKKRFDGFEPAALERLVAYAWPGNVRELRNALERVVLLHAGPLVTREALVLDDGPRPQPRLVDPRPMDRAASARASGFTLGDAELQALVRALEAAAGNQTRAAALLGVSRDTVRALMQKHNVRIEVRAVVDGPRTPAG
jgi:two-component system response regulator HydG